MMQLPQFAEDFAKDTHTEHLRITREWVALFALVALGAVGIAALLGAAVTLTAPLWIILPLLTAFTLAAAVAMIVMRTLEYARYTLQARFDEWQANQETGREIATIQATQITNVNVKGKSNVVSVNSGTAVENIQLIPVYGATKNAPRRMLDGIDERDLIYFCDRAPLIGHAKRAWLGATLPSGKVVATFEDYSALVAPLLKAGLIVGRGERSAGKLATNDTGELRATLGLPSGEEIKTIGG